MIEKFKNKSFISLWILTTLSFYLIIISAFRGMVKESFIATVFFVPCLIAIIFLLSKKQCTISDKKLIFFQIFAHIYSLATIIIIISTYQTAFFWDIGRLLNDATSIVLEGSNPTIEYYLRYPNNQFWLSFLVVFFNFCKYVLHIITPDGLRIASTIMSVVFIRLTYLFMFLSAKQVFGNKKARFFDILAMMFIPPYLYAQFAYSDTIGILLVSILIYIFLIFRKNKLSFNNYRFWIFITIFAILVSLIYHIKIMALIVVIAIFIAEIINKNTQIKNIMSRTVIITTMSALFIFIFSLPIESITKVDNARADEFKFPTSHWVMMSMNASGGYNPQDVIFTKELGNYQAKKEGTQKQIIDRAKEKGFLGLLKHITDIKLLRQWGNSLLAGDDYISRSPSNQNSFFERLFGIKQFDNDARYHWICLIFSWIFYALLLLGCFISILFSYKTKKLNFLQIAILGMFLFFSIWECNSRYLLVFVPVLLLCSFMGWNYMRNYLLKNNNRIKKLF